MSPASASQTSDVRETILEVGQRIMGAKGFSAVGLNEILAQAGVPKGSFYHYFGSKDAFGEALLKRYFDDYLVEMDQMLGQSGLTMAQRLDQYWENWRANQSFADCQGKCLAVKLGAEVADLSEPMRAALKLGTDGIVERLGRAIAAGKKEGSFRAGQDTKVLAQCLYQLWLGASVMVKISRSTQPFQAALTTTHELLQPA
ncbi:TetR/AcrR family transcriptional regulator [Dyella sp. C11]|uniref:TetR/AcrR family transcriptional regulator n=1 Tax=Dyella sp. C11 TaxID=2126991 RepID=UPI000D659D28|nr:TetR/AcrR family transcriptional regulator [Dyella sp. C11]